MKNLIRLKDLRAVRLAASAMAVAAVIAGAAGLAAGQGNAAPPNKADGPSRNTDIAKALPFAGRMPVKHRTGRCPGQPNDVRPFGRSFTGAALLLTERTGHRTRRVTNRLRRDVSGAADRAGAARSPRS